jgi:beta-galactosidase
MEFRSYYSGKTVIRATSPGLKDGTITLTTLGEPKFIAGKTSPVKQRRYVRYTGPLEAVSTTPANSVFGLNNPTLASSEMAEHSARFGNDGNAFTFWRAQDNDSIPWWRVDLERAVTMAETKIIFPSEANYRYKIEVSSDGLVWTPVADQTQTTSTDKIRTDVLAKEISGHLVRVTFAGKPAAVAELEVSGRLTVQ